MIFNKIIIRYDDTVTDKGGNCMLRIAICDDGVEFREWLGRVIEKWASQRHLNIQLKKFITGEELLADIEATGYFDIVLMDIVLGGGMDGVTIAAKIKEIYNHICLIFISQYDNYYKEAFRVHPFQYFEKPTSEKKIIENLDQAEKDYRFSNENYVFRFRDITYSVKLCEVLYFVSDRRVIRIYMENGDVYKFYKKLDDLEEQLKRFTTRFLRIHKSYLVNGNQILQFHPKFVVMRNKQQLSISAEKRGIVMQYHMNLLENM